MSRRYIEEQEMGDLFQQAQYFDFFPIINSQYTWQSFNLQPREPNISLTYLAAHLRNFDIPDRVNVNDENQFGCTPLALLLSKGKYFGEMPWFLDLIKEILQRGADPNWMPQKAASRRLCTGPCLYMAAECGIKAFELLLEYGADIHMVDADGMHLLKHQYSELLCDVFPVHEYSTMWAHMLLDGWRCMPGFGNILHYAARLSWIINMPVMDKLISSKPEVIQYINMPDDNGKLPRYYCKYVTDALTLLKEGFVINFLINYKFSRTSFRAYTLHLHTNRRSELLMLYEAIFNKGLLSKVFSGFHTEKLNDLCQPYWKSEISTIDQILWEPIWSLEAARSDIQILNDALIDQDIHISIDKNFYGKVCDIHRIGSYFHKSRYFNRLHCDSEQNSVVSLKRLCRKILRQDLSTNYAKTWVPFDLRNLFTKLPIPVSLQHYLMVKLIDFT